jgi:hypothetical protein
LPPGGEAITILAEPDAGEFASGEADDDVTFDDEFANELADE